MSEKKSGYLQRLVEAFLNRPPSSPAGESADVNQLRLELDDRDRKITEMRREYEILKSAGQDAHETGGDERVEQVFKRLSGTLSNLVCLASSFRRGQQVEMEDLVDLVETLSKDLGRAGMEPIGSVGEDMPFDTSLHQRMSGGMVRDGVPVTVRIPGYRFGERILSKALVSAVEENGDG